MKEQLATEGEEVQKEGAGCFLSPSVRGEEREGKTGDRALGTSEPSSSSSREALG